MFQVDLVYATDPNLPYRPAGLPAKPADKLSIGDYPTAVVVKLVPHSNAASNNKVAIYLSI